jgi:hypothetical protein
MLKRLAVLGFILTLAFALGIGLACAPTPQAVDTGSTSPSPGEVFVGAVTTSPQDSSTTPPAAPQKKPPTTTASTSHVASWVKVATLSGYGDKRGLPFTLTGATASLSYNITSSSYPICIVYVVPKGDSLDANGGFDEVWVTTPGADSTVLAQPPGDYYLDVRAANCGWTVVIEEWR